MKKGMKWFKKKLDDIEVNTASLQNYNAIWMLNRVHELVAQLDEQEVLSQEWIDEHAVSVAYDGMPDETEIVYVDDLQNLLVPKQEELESKIQELIEVYKQEEDAYSNPENGWIGGFIEDLKNLVADEPKYYALVKGHELIKGRGNWVPKYWNLDMADGDMHISDRDTVHGKYLTEASKSEWNELGINDSNADFVRAEGEQEW